MNIDTAYVFVTTGSAGDLFPFLRMAVSLQQRGHDVRLVGPHLHEAAVRQAGIVFHGTVADPAVLDDKDLWHPLRGFGVVWRAVRPGLRELPHVIAQPPPQQPCVIIAHPLAVPDAVLLRATRGGVRVLAAYLAPSNIPTVHDPLTLGPYTVPRWVPHAVRRWLWRQVAARAVDPVALPEVNADRAKAALAPVASLFDLMRTGPDLHLALFPPWFGACKPDWPEPLVQGDFALYDPDPEAPFAPEAQAFLAAGDAPIIFTHGTGNRQARAFFDHALDASLRLGRRAILLTPHREQVAPDLPPSVLWQPYLPLQRLLPRSAAIVQHGGVGTSAEALRSRVPQLVVPLAFDQFDNGARIKALGAGLVLRHDQLDGKALCEALARLLALPAGGHWPGPEEARWTALIDSIVGQPLA